jgi:hypothetical protein
MVGRKTRRAEDVTNRLNSPAPVLSRAMGLALPNGIFKPVVVAKFPAKSDSTYRCHAHGTAQNRHGCPIQQLRPGRAEFFALPIRGVILSAKS